MDKRTARIWRFQFRNVTVSSRLAHFIGSGASEHRVATSSALCQPASTVDAIGIFLTSVERAASSVWVTRGNSGDRVRQPQFVSRWSNVRERECQAYESADAYSRPLPVIRGATSEVRKVDSALRSAATGSPPSHAVSCTVPRVISPWKLIVRYPSFPTILPNLT